jgi:hypothetical protein
VLNHPVFRIHHSNNHYLASDVDAEFIAECYAGLLEVSFACLWIFVIRRLTRFFRSRQQQLPIDSPELVC